MTLTRSSRVLAKRASHQGRAQASFRNAGRAERLLRRSRLNQEEKLADIEVMLAQTPKLPPALQRIATTPVLASERPAGFPQVKVPRLAPPRRIHTLGDVRIDFSSGHASESASYALMRT